MSYTKIESNHLDFFIKTLGKKNVLTGKDVLNYSSDHTEDLIYQPEAVLFPKSTELVSRIVSYCNSNLIPITPSASLTGLSGGALPYYKGVSISMKKMNNILKIDESNFQAFVEPGLINEDFQNKLSEKGLFYPPDPASKGSCTLGGNIALNAGGPKALKYGVTSNYIINLEVVLPNGNVIWTGANTLKNSTGYNLTQLMVGSEGTLGIVTKAVIKLISKPKYTLLMLIPFNDLSDSCDVVSKIFLEGISPSSIEFMEKSALEIVQKNQFAHIPFELNENEKSYLLIELDGNKEKNLLEHAEKLYSIFENYNCGEILIAETSAQKENLWKMRRNIGLAVKSYSIYKEEDTVVPRNKLPDLIKGVKRIGKEYNFNSICYGHAGDGNLHINILKENLSDSDWNMVVKKGIREIFNLCVKLGGTISGEHGIGLVQKDYIDIPFSKEMISLQKEIKSLFDPNNIMNPGKIFPD